MRSTRYSMDVSVVGKEDHNVTIYPAWYSYVHIFIVIA